MWILVAFALAWLGLGRLVLRRWAWREVALAVALAMLAAQLLPAGHPFRAETAAWGKVLIWLGVAAIPIGAYALWVRSLRRRTGVDAPVAAAAAPVGLVQFPDDAALAAETAAALLAEAPGKRLTLGWRGAEGRLEGVLRLRLAEGLAEVELFQVIPEARGRGLGSRLLAAAEAEAAAWGARRIGALVASWQGEAAFLRAGWTEAGAAGGRRWLEKRLG